MSDLKPVHCGCGGEAKVDKHTYYRALPTYGVRCHRCGQETRQFYMTEAEAIKAWNKAMSGNVQDCAKVARYSDPDDLISRQDAINAMMALKQEDDERYGCEIPEGFDGQRAVETLEKLPSAEPERTAKVIEHDASVTDTDGYKYHRSEYLCGACKKKVIGGDDYCSHCGARLEWE